MDSTQLNILWQALLRHLAVSTCHTFGTANGMELLARIGFGPLGTTLLAPMQTPLVSGTHNHTITALTCYVPSPQDTTGLVCLLLLDSACVLLLSAPLSEL